MPLSAAQQQMWFLDRLQPDSSLYTIPVALRLRGTLDKAALRIAFQTIVDRHDALRTQLPDVSGVPEQRVTDIVVSIPEEDYENVPEPDKETVVRARTNAIAHAPFELGRGPLFRLRLIRLGEFDHILIIVAHHTVFDGASLGILLRELNEFYSAARAGRPPAAPPPPASYADFARWQATADLDGQLAFWRGKLATVPPPLQLTTDRPRPPVQSYRGACARFAVPAEIAERVAALSERAGTTVFLTFLTAFHVLLARYTAQRDIAVGVPVFNRPTAALDELIGCFVNTVTIRADLPGGITFLDALEHVSAEALDAFEHLDVPFDDVVRAVVPDRDTSYSPLVQVSFGMVTEQVAGRPELAGLDVETLEVERVTAKFDLSLDLLSTGAGLTGEIEYNTDLFDEATVRRTAGHWLRLLTEVTADPDRPIADYPILTGAEWDQSVVGWNDTAADVPAPHLMHHLFEREARRVPDATAVVCGDSRISYRELDERANQLAHALVARGVGPEVSVGVCLERSIDTIVAFLGVLKSGGVFTPLDPDYPAERLAFMIADARAQLLVVDSGVAATLPLGDVPRIVLDAGRAELDRLPVTPPRTLVRPENLSCVFYTSGSSGTPKCAMLTHLNYANYVHFWETTYHVSQVMRVHLQMTSFAFDIFVADATRALFSGATLVIAPREVVMSPERLYALMLAERVNSAEFITPILAALVDHLERTGQDLAFMDLLVAGSDIWYARDYLRARRLCRPTTRIVAAYGTSETSIDNSTLVDTEVPDDAEGIVAVGRPALNTRLYVLNERMRPVPAGIAGELYIGGAGVGRGYLRRPGLTAQRYVPDPFAAEPNARLYRTGDLTRYRPDGVIEILGRVDNQVKVGGFRIELGEIEDALRQHPTIDRSVVLARETGSGDRRLVGYVTQHDPASPVTDDELRVHLQARLPGYMVPSVVVRLARMPLNANGKIDRRALPAPDAELFDATGHVAPRTPVEEILAGIWCEVLELATVGVHDNFFGLGGSSLMLTQVASRIRASLRVEVPLREIYGLPTIAELARRLATGVADTAGPPPITARPPAELAEPSYAQQRMWFLNQLAPDDPAYNSLTVLRLTGELVLPALARAIDTVLARHDVLRTVFAQVDGMPRLVVLDPVARDLAVTDLSALPEPRRGAELTRLVHQDERAPFDLATGPLLRTSVVRLAADDHVLLLNLHHIVTDGWSAAILFDELSAAYTAEVTGTSPDLPEVTLRYADFAAWQREWLRGEVLAEQLEYWRGQMAGAPAVLDLPLDRPRPAVSSHFGDSFVFPLPGRLTGRLRALCQAEGVTLFMALLGSFQATLARHTGQDDIVVGSPIANRTRVELERMPGFFANTLALRTDLSGDPSFRAVLHRVREVALDAYAHQDLPFEKLVEQLAPERSMGHHPLFQVLLVLQDTPQESADLPGLRLEWMPYDSSVSQFDLSVSIAVTEDGLEGTVWYKTELFDRSTVESVLTSWRLLLDRACAAPDTRLAALPVSPPSTVDVESLELPATARIDDLVAAQVARTPNAIAVEDGDTRLTYAELDAAATDLAGELRALGAGPDVLIGLVLPRSADAVTAILAVLRTGAAYVPVDPLYPEVRRATMLRATAAVITAGLRVTGGHDRVRPGPVARPGPDDAAYVCYTSGSTGTPKGVVVSHRSLVNHSLAVDRHFALTPGDRVLQCRSLSFDAAAEEIFPALTHGATLVIGREALERGAEEFTDLVLAHRLTVVSLPTAFWARWADTGDGLRALAGSGLRFVLAAGEQAHPGHLRAWKDHVGETVTWCNVYGPTEATITTSVYRAGQDWERDCALTVPIGTPIANVTAHVLDRHHRPVPDGVVGELHVGGAALARGYLDQPAATAARFVPDPFGTGGRLYRTGDLVRRAADGTLRFVGRDDGQVKVLGHRVEPGEVAAALAAHPSVRDAVVLHTDERLVGYVAATGVTAAALRAHLERTLPRHLVPSAFVVLDDLPLTPNGKVDRAALTASAARRVDEHVEPATPVEHVLSAIWCEVLDRTEVSATADFFEIGGHSLLAAKVLSRIRGVLSVALPVRALFDHRTLDALAAAITTALTPDQHERIAGLVAQESAR
ncbi:hypothetical protein BLA60_40950 [Actinophytocola xinjiangensis]|uniref:Carrier domain-containing protein n=1 Tax=Actinophytocola xinjiangensis TaxID=485602 RepID=A0A7Z1ATY5_9PSEU|nr:hypothetical protein BLA60_40950 [Actinophytocola xinjiangensis]